MSDVTPEQGISALQAVKVLWDSAGGARFIIVIFGVLLLWKYGKESIGAAQDFWRGFFAFIRERRDRHQEYMDRKIERIGQIEDRVMTEREKLLDDLIARINRQEFEVKALRDEVTACHAQSNQQAGQILLLQSQITSSQEKSGALAEALTVARGIIEELKAKYENQAAAH